jgi:hypothetical protein
VPRRQVIEVTSLWRWKQCTSFRVVDVMDHLPWYPHSVGWVGVTGMRYQPPFVVSGTLHGSGGERADAFNAPLINLGMGYELSLQLSLVA